MVEKKEHIKQVIGRTLHCLNDAKLKFDADSNKHFVFTEQSKDGFEEQEIYEYEHTPYDKDGICSMLDNPAFVEVVDLSIKEFLLLSAETVGVGAGLYYIGLAIALSDCYTEIELSDFGLSIDPLRGLTDIISSKFQHPLSFSHCDKFSNINIEEMLSNCELKVFRFLDEIELSGDITGEHGDL